MNLALWLERAARVFPQRTAVWLGEQPQLDYAGLAARTARLAGHLRHTLGLAPGERVALYMDNQVAYLEVLYAALWAGLAVVPMNAKLHPKEVLFILGDAEASVLFASEALAASLQPHRGQMPALRQLLIPGQADYQAALGAPLALRCSTRRLTMVGAANRHKRPTVRDSATSSAGSKPPEAGTTCRAARVRNGKL
jgi:long-chain acyl-CoA synthetase